MPAVDLPPKRKGSLAPWPAARQTRTAMGSQIVAKAASSTPAASMAFKSTVLSPGTPPPGLPQTSASTTGRCGEASAVAIASSGVASGPKCLPRLAKSSAARDRAMAVAVGVVAIDGDHDLAAHLGHIAGAKPVDDGDVQEPGVVALEVAHLGI